MNIYKAPNLIIDLSVCVCVCVGMGRGHGKGEWGASTFQKRSQLFFYGTQVSCGCYKMTVSQEQTLSPSSSVRERLVKTERAKTAVVRSGSEKNLQIVLYSR